MPSQRSGRSSSARAAAATHPSTEERSSSASSFDYVDASDGSTVSLIEDELAQLSLNASSGNLAPTLANVPPTIANVRALAQAQAAPSVRRQFVCPEHGTYWKKVPPEGNKQNGACVARCKKCPLVNGVGIKYVAIPVDEERGKGLFHCRECDNTWTSNTACRKLTQYCWAEGCTARDNMIGELPSEIRSPDPGWMRARRFARARANNPTIDEDAPFQMPEAHAGGGGGADGVDGGFGAGVGSGGAARRRRPHHCAGCATGECKQPPPLSPVHVSTGSTAATISGKTWSTANSEWSLGSVHTDRSPATTSRSRRRRFLGGGRAADAEEPISMSVPPDW